MCRFAAYVGSPVSLATLLYEAPHSLEHQSYVPREMVSGHVNVDGTGVAWWRDGADEPLRYVSERPPWSDPNLPSLSPRLTGSPVLAVVRSQTPGMPAGVAAAHPFARDRWAGSHNGYLEGFADIKWDLVELIDPDLRAGIDALSDSALLFLIAVSRLRGAPASTLADALVGTVADAAALCSSAGRAASLNLVIADGEGVAALRMARGVEPNSLYWVERSERWPGGSLIASEPLDGDPGWREVPADHVVSISGDGLECSARSFSV